LSQLCGSARRCAFVMGVEKLRQLLPQAFIPLRLVAKQDGTLEQRLLQLSREFAPQFDNSQAQDLRKSVGVRAGNLRSSHPSSSAKPRVRLNLLGGDAATLTTYKGLGKATALFRSGSGAMPLRGSASNLAHGRARTGQRPALELCPSFAGTGQYAKSAQRFGAGGGKEPLGLGSIVSDTARRRPSR
jgi:hypothetical protein